MATTQTTVGRFAPSEHKSADSASSSSGDPDPAQRISYHCDPSFGAGGKTVGRGPREAPGTYKFTDGGFKQEQSSGDGTKTAPDPRLAAAAAALESSDLGGSDDEDLNDSALEISSIEGNTFHRFLGPGLGGARKDGKPEVGEKRVKSFAPNPADPKRQRKLARDRREAQTVQKGRMAASCPFLGARLCNARNLLSSQWTSSLEAGPPPLQLSGGGGGDDAITTREDDATATTRCGDGDALRNRSRAAVQDAELSEYSSGDSDPGSSTNARCKIHKVSANTRARGDASGGDGSCASGRRCSSGSSGSGAAIGAQDDGASKDSAGATAGPWARLRRDELVDSDSSTWDVTAGVEQASATGAFARLHVEGVWICLTCGLKRKEKKAIESHTEAEHSQVRKFFKCPYCRFWHKDRHLFQKHLRNQHKAHTKVYADNCTVTEQSPNSGGDLITSKPRALKDVGIEKKIGGLIGSRDDGSDLILVCLACGKEAKARRNSGFMRDHVESQHVQTRRLFKCSYCSFTHKIQRKFMEHLTKQHRGQAQVTAENYVIKETTDDLAVAEAGDQVDITGDQVDSTGHSSGLGVVQRTNELISRNTNNSAWICLACDKEYMSVGMMKTHIESQHINHEFKFKCPYCEYTEKTNSYFLAHLARYHKDLSPVNANKCMISFCDSDHHYYKCPDCEYSQKSRDAFHGHLRLTHKKIGLNVDKFLIHADRPWTPEMSTARKPPKKRGPSTSKPPKKKYRFLLKDFLEFEKKWLANDEDLWSAYAISMTPAELKQKIDSRLTGMLDYWTCLTCGKDYEGPNAKRNVMNHIEGHHVRPRYKCPHCKHRPKSRRQFMSHFKLVHRNFPRVEPHDYLL